MKYKENHNKQKYEFIARDETIKKLFRLSSLKQVNLLKLWKSCQWKYIISPEREACICRIGGKLYVSKESPKSHIQTSHERFHYSNSDILKCRICGNEFNIGKLITKICVDHLIIVKHL